MGEYLSPALASQHYPTPKKGKGMEVYVITASDFCGEDTKILSVWDNDDEAQAEVKRVAPDEFDVRVLPFYLSGTDAAEWRR